MDRIPKVSPQEMDKQGNSPVIDTQAVQQPENSKPLALDLEAVRPREDASLENISLSFKSNSEFEMKGRDSSLKALDVEKAISDMQKDQSLLQYQYFVGDSNIIRNDEDGVVFQKAPQSL